MVSITIILVSLLFLASLLNIILNCPTKKLLGWFKSLFIPTTKKTSSDIKVVSQSCPPSTGSVRESASSKERSARVAEKENNRRGDGGDGDRGFDEQKKMLFSTFDRNGDGFITRQELRDSLHGIRIFLSEEEVDEIIERSDGNGDGLIDFDEFCKLLEDSSMGFGSGDRDGGDVEGGLKEAFDVFDKDRDGLISVEELGSVMCSLGLISEGGKKVEDCKEMIRKVDMDGDGMVNFDEFKRMMMMKPQLVSAY